jgi:helicase-like protein
VGETASFFGRANRFDNEGFYGPAEPGQGYPLGEELMPPDLVIQDELHLISGPLGSIAGIYETAIDRLCARKRPDGHDGYAWVRPKLVASTATVRRAASQVKALFGRAESSVFPPPGIDRTDSFFARTSPVTESDPRLYVGLAAQGRSPKVIFLRTMLSSMAAAYLQWIANGGRAKDAGTGKNKLNPADPYLTSLCYFNALKELGAARRIVEGEVQAPLSNYGMRRKRVSEAAPILGNRPIKQLPEELTSRISNDEVAEAKRKLEIRFDADGKAYEDAVDVALATNMISVGLDIPRLGQMVVSGQPKAAAEYIQATSRVGRDADKPGLVFALLNIHRPRDRSHYEHFATFHAAFYRAVEAATVAPFVPRSLDRALAAAVVAMARLEDDQLTPERAAIFARDAAPGFPTFAKEFRDRADASAVDLIGGGAGVESRATEIFNAWVRLSTSATAMGYADRKGGKRLLKEMLGAEAEISDPDELLFRSPRSMRDVEPEVRLKVRTLKGVDVGD